MKIITLGIVFGVLAALFIGNVKARDDGRYANSPLKSWFDKLENRKGGRCCSDADGTAISDAEWESQNGHYRVLIMDEWWDVPDESVVIEPNRAGKTMVWPVYYHDADGKLKIDIRCFMPGVMT